MARQSVRGAPREQQSNEEEQRGPQGEPGAEANGWAVYRAVVGDPGRGLCRKTHEQTLVPDWVGGRGRVRENFRFLAWVVGRWALEPPRVRTLKEVGDEGFHVKRAELGGPVGRPGGGQVRRRSEGGPQTCHSSTPWEPARAMPQTR